MNDSKQPAAVLLNTLNAFFPNALTTFWKCFLNGFATHFASVETHWKCSSTHLQCVENALQRKNASTLFSLSLLFPNRVTYVWFLFWLSYFVVFRCLLNLNMRIVEATKGSFLHNNCKDELSETFELSGMISSDVWVGSPNSQKYFLSYMIFIIQYSLYSIRYIVHNILHNNSNYSIALASDYLGLQANFQFFNKDCQCTCHSVFLWNTCMLTVAFLQSKVIKELEAGNERENE